MTGGAVSEKCEGCCEVIYDRFVMKVSNSSWHEDCLFCSDCHSQLTNSCYYKDGKLLCKADYEKRFGVKCGRCGQSLSPHDLVMRTISNIFHLHCFICAVCGRPLTRGDQYVVRSGQVVCRADYEKEYFLVQSFAPQEMVQESQQGPADDFVVETSGGRQRDGRRGPKRPRTILTAAQRRKFKESFNISPKPCRKVREALGRETGLSVRVVQVWFQNQRAKMKKMQRRGKVEKDSKDKDDGSQKDAGGGSADNGEGSGGSNASVKKDNSSEHYEADSATSNDAFSDDDESILDNLDESDTPDTPVVDGGLDTGSKPPSQLSMSSSTTREPPKLAPPQQHHHTFVQGHMHPGLAAPAGSSSMTNRGAHPHQFSNPHHHQHHLHHHQQQQQQQHHQMPDIQAGDGSILQNPIDKLYLMQDSYFTQM